MNLRTALCALIASTTVSAFGVESKCLDPSEPNVELAKLWWPDQRNVFTPVGWKDHYFRFNVIYNGTIFFEPFSDLSSRKHAVQWKGNDFQATFTPCLDTSCSFIPKEQIPLWKFDGGHGLQGWRTNCETPVLWTDFPTDEGVVIRQEVFGHLKGGQSVVTGMEPLYAWIRLSVLHVDPLRAPKKMPMVVQLSRNYHALAGRFLNENGVTIDIIPDRAPYPKPLKAQRFSSEQQGGLRVVEPDGKIRFVVLPTSEGGVSFQERSNGVYAVVVDMPSNVGHSVDLLMPMFSQDSEECKTEEALGFEGALAQSEAYWQRCIPHTARMHVPEEYINRAVAQTVKFAALNGEKDYKTGEYSFLTGSWGYDQLWPTPVSMNSHMLLSLLGYNDMVAQYSDLFRKHQGEIKPPGKSFSKHPGYFGSPTNLASIDWLSDHGAVLLQVSSHALLSGDQKFIADWTEPIIKGCEFIRDACAQTNHDGVVGLLPPAVATDDGIPTQAVWNLAWNYKGLAQAVRFLKRIHHPRAGEFEDVADKYKATFVRAYREAAQRAPKWKDQEGREYPKPPTSLSKNPMPFHVYSDAFYLDTGPLVLVWAGLFDANDPLMEATLKFFREGPNWKLKGPRFNAISRPVLEHEISTCEPCYSWNVYHAWQLNDRPHFLQGLYGLFTAAVSQQTFSGSEHRTGIADQIAPVAMGFKLARLAVIDDEIKDGELHLLRLCPVEWISSQDSGILENMPTVYGPVDLQWKLSSDGETLNISFKGHWRSKPTGVVLHVPDRCRATSVSINGKRMSVKREIEIKDF